MATQENAAHALETLLDRLGEAERDPATLRSLEISADRGHRVEPAQVPWVTALLRRLVAAREGDAPDAGSLPDVIEGWRCMTCGYADVTAQEVERFVAGRALHEDLVDTLSKGGDAVVEAAFRAEADGADDDRMRIREALMRRGLEVVTRRPPRCPSCEGEQTCAYRWRLTDDGGLEATRDNEPLRAAG